MRTATALVVPRRLEVAEPAYGQIPLPFPSVGPVLPVPVERTGEIPAAPLRERSARFLQALVEILAGDRPARQMMPWMAPDVYRHLQNRVSAGTRPAGPRGRGARIASVHVCMVDDGIAEVAGRMVHRGRSRAIAIRLELLPDHRGVRAWRCTALVWA